MSLIKLIFFLQICKYHLNTVRARCQNTTKNSLRQNNRLGLKEMMRESFGVAIDVSLIAHREEPV